MRFKLLSITLFFVLLGAGAGAAAEVVYKWTDDGGEVHFSDQPQGDGSQPLDLQVAPRYPSARQRQAPADGDEAAAEGKGRREVVDAKEQQEIRRKNCETARRALQRNKNLGRMYRVGADGERHYLSDKERKQVLDRSRANVDKWCD